MDLQTYAIVTGDSDALMLALHTTERRRQKRKRFLLSDIPDDRCYFYFRFEKGDIIRLARALQLPTKMKAGWVTYSNIEGLCLLLRRLAYPNRLEELSPMFHRRRDELSRIFNSMLKYISQRFGYLLSTFTQSFLTPPFLTRYASRIKEKGSPLTHCWGFIDGTIRGICWPRLHQRQVYNGHKRKHALKFQSIVTPNGLVANLYGPVVGRRHDCYLLSKSNVLQDTQNLVDINGVHFYLYGDSGYPLRAQLQRGFKRSSNITPAQKAFNKLMSSCRECVEWEFGKISKIFAFLDFSKNLKLFLQPVGLYYIVGALLTNCHTCLYGSQTSQFYSLNPPKLEEYLSNTCN